MIHLGLTARLIDDPAAILTYDAYRADVWPEVVDANRRCRIRRVLIYRSGRDLFMSIEADDRFRVEDFPGCLSHPRALEWQAIMDGLLEEAPTGVPGLRWTTMAEICRVEIEPVAGA